MIAKDVRRFLKQLQTMLTVLARDGRHVELQSRFEDFQKLLDAWLDIVPPDTAAPDRLRWLVLVDRFGGPLEIDINKIARAAALSADSSTVVVVANEIMQGAFSCYHRNQPKLMDEFLQTLVFLYYQCVDHDGVADALGHRIDSGLHSLLMTMRFNHSDSDDRPSTTNPNDTTMLEAVLRFSLALVHAAIRYEKVKDATFFVERIFEHRRYHPRHHSSEPAASAMETLFDYVAVVLVGWALHILQSRRLKDPEAAQTVLSAALAQVPSAPVLLAQWELLRGSEWQDAAIDNRLGVSRWDLRDWQRDFRSGVGEVRMGGPDWVRMGLRASLLRTDERFYGDVGELFPTQPRRFVWDAAKEREALLSLSVDPWIGVPEDKRQQRIDSAMAIIEQRARGASANYLRYVLESPLSESRLTAFRDDALQALSSKSSWLRAFQRAGLCIEDVRLCPTQIRWGNWVPRECLLENNNWASDFGKHLGKDAASREAMAIIHLIETSAPRAVNLGTLATLREKVRDARRLLTDAGFEPNVLILPRENRFAAALFQKPLWQVEGRQEFGDANIGSWEQLHVLRFPYTDPNSILLLDTRCLVGKHGPDHGPPFARVWFDEECSNDNVQSKKSAARAALNSTDLPIPESSTIQVLTRIEFAPRLGLVDTDAARTIDIRGSDAYFVIIDGSKLYHRPDCPDIDGTGATYVLRVDRDDGMTPCTICKPDRWDFESRLDAEREG